MHVRTAVLLRGRALRSGKASRAAKDAATGHHLVGVRHAGRRTTRTTDRHALAPGRDSKLLPAAGVGIGGTPTCGTKTRIRPASSDGAGPAAPSDVKLRLYDVVTWNPIGAPLPASTAGRDGEVVSSRAESTDSLRLASG